MCGCSASMKKKMMQKKYHLHRSSNTQTKLLQYFTPRDCLDEGSWPLTMHVRESQPLIDKDLRRGLLCFNPSSENTNASQWLLSTLLRIERKPSGNKTRFRSLLICNSLRELPCKPCRFSIKISSGRQK